MEKEEKLIPTDYSQFQKASRIVILDTSGQFSERQQPLIAINNRRVRWNSIEDIVDEGGQKKGERIIGRYEQ
jgi:hypothetical protein